VFDVETRDGALLRVKPFAIAEKRIQSSQKKLIRNVMKVVISKEGKTKTLNAFIKDCLDGKIGSEIYKNCKVYYPVKRIEINKTEIMRLPTIIIEDEKPTEKKEEEPVEPKEPIKEESEVPSEEEITEEKPAEEELPKEEKEAPAEEELPAEETEKAKKPKKKTKAKTTTKKKTTAKKKKKKELPPE
jgi:hypothetical protein